MSLGHLPDACVLAVLFFLGVRDVLRFRRACRRFKLLLDQSQNDYWLPRLRKDYGLHLQAWAFLRRLSSLPSDTCLRKLQSGKVAYLRIYNSSEVSSETRCCALVHQAVRTGTALSSLHRRLSFAVRTATLDEVRFMGLYTDGGTDDALRQYGVDNMCAQRPPPMHLIRREVHRIALSTKWLLIAGFRPTYGRATAARARPTSTPSACSRCAYWLAGYLKVGRR